MVGIANRANVGLRERKKEDTRAKLLAAALRLISRHGYDATSIDDIVSSVGVSKRTFFRYFESKDDVLVAWVGRFGEHACNSLVARPKHEKPTLALQNAIISAVTLYESQYFLSTPLERAISSNHAVLGKNLLKFKLCAESMSHALAQRMNTSINTDFAPVVLAHSVIAVLQGTWDTWRMQGSKGKFSAVLTRVFSRLKLEIKSD